MFFLNLWSVWNLAFGLLENHSILFLGLLQLMNLAIALLTLTMLAQILTFLVEIYGISVFPAGLSRPVNLAKLKQLDFLAAVAVFSPASIHAPITSHQPHLSCSVPAHLPLLEIAHGQLITRPQTRGKHAQAHPLTHLPHLLQIAHPDTQQAQ